MDKNKLELINKAIKNDKKALIELIKNEQSNIYATLYYLKKDRYEINDIMQNILIKLTNKISQLKNPANFKTWLNQIIINTYYDYLRKNKQKYSILSLDKNNDENTFEIADNTTNPQENLLKNELDLIIKTSIENLPIHYKIPITLREIQGLSYDEISNITKTTIGTVKSRISRARAIIKDDINKYSKG